MAAQFRSVRIKGRNEFDRLIEHLTHEAYRARANWDFWAEFESACDDYSIELNAARAFWELTRRAHKDAVVLRLGRLYDPHATATSLGNLLQTIKENVGDVTGWVPTPIDIADLDSEMDAVSDEDPAVAKLLRLRNEYLAHRGTKHVAKGTFASLPTLERNDISALMKRALDLLHKYRERLGYSELGWGHHEAEDFRRLLSLVRAGLKSKTSS